MAIPNQDALASHNSLAGLRALATPAQKRIFWAILALALLARLWVAVGSTYVWDEDRSWIPAAQSIEFSEGSLLPWRIPTLSHSTLTAYIMTPTIFLFGENALGFRLPFVLFGVLLVWALGVLLWEWLGFAPAALAMLTLAVNEYHIGASILATEKSPYLAMVAVASLCFARFLRTENPRYLYGVAVFGAFGYLFKEIAILLALPVVLILAITKFEWLKRKEPYLAAVLFLVIVAPDLYVAASATPAEQTGGYGLHYSRIGGVGVTRHYLLFFIRDAIRAVYAVRGQTLLDPAEEYPSMNFLLGGPMLLFGAFLVWKWKSIDSTAKFVTAFFWIVFLIFTFIKPGKTQLGDDPYAWEDPAVWFWVDLTLIGGTALLAVALTLLERPLRQAATAVLALAILLAGYNIVFKRLNLPTLSAESNPAALWPPSGNLEHGRVHFQPCMICAPTFKLTEVFVRDLGKLGDADTPARVPTAEELQGVQLGADVRDFRFLAKPAEGAERRIYAFRYSVEGRFVKERSAEALVRISNQARPLPFWAGRTASD